MSSLLHQKHFTLDEAQASLAGLAGQVERLVSLKKDSMKKDLMFTSVSIRG